MWTITRQRQWPDGNNVVEISAGGLDYTNPGALGKKYDGEFREFDDPRKAVEKAIEIAKAWQRDEPDKEILIAHGATGGYTMPFDGEELSDDTYAALRKWAERVWEQVPKCDRCGDPIPQSGKDKGGFRICEDPDFGTFCSENCAEIAWSNATEEET